MEWYAQKEEDLLTISPKFLKSIKNHKIIALKGEMGVGKTTFLSYLMKEMQVKEPISSPTYGYVNTYESIKYGTIHHFDFYRIENERQAYDIGIEEYIYGKDWVFMEWPEKIENLLPENTVWLTITKEEKEGRRFEIEI